MNFLEALEVNKTKEVKAISTEQRIFNVVFKPGELLDVGEWVLAYIQSDWEIQIEPMTSKGSISDSCVANPGKSGCVKLIIDWETYLELKKLYQFRKTTLLKMTFEPIP